MTQCVAEEPVGSVLVFFLHSVSHSTIGNREEIKNVQQIFESIRSKFSAVHFCCPKSPFYDAVRATYVMLVGKENRSRLRFHIGSYQECKYSLKSFGIPVGQLPNNLLFEKTESVMKNKLRNHHKWLAVRKALERVTQEEVISIKASAVAAAVSDDNSGSGDSFFGVCNHILENNENYDSVAEMMAVQIVRSKFIDCPYHEDCLFGKGRPAMKHPGNVAMRRLLAEKYDRYEYDVINKSVVASEILGEIKQGSGRFLREYTDQYAGLMVQVDDKTALQKINIAFRDLRKRRLRLDKKFSGEKRSSTKSSTTTTTEISSLSSSVEEETDAPTVRAKSIATNIESSSVSLGVDDEVCNPFKTRKRSRDDSPSISPINIPDFYGSSNAKYI